MLFISFVKIDQERIQIMRSIRSHALQLISVRIKNSYEK